MNNGTEPRESSFTSLLESGDVGSMRGSRGAGSCQEDCLGFVPVLPLSSRESPRS